MDCTKCGKIIGDGEEPIFQVRKGYTAEVRPYKHMVPDTEEFYPEYVIGYYCAECLSKGV